MQQWKMRPIGYVRSPYENISEIPKGLGAEHKAKGSLEIFPEFEEGLRDIDGFSHLFIIWVFHKSDGFQLVGVSPADERTHGVFATRSPYRPNAIGLSVVELIKRDGNLLHLRGVDMLNGTPVLDVKPYMSSVPAEDLKRGWLAEAEARRKKK